MAGEILLTKDGYNAKVEELNELRTKKRPEIAERLKEAIAYGDISENSEYDKPCAISLVIVRKAVEMQSPKGLYYRKKNDEVRRWRIN